MEIIAIDPGRKNLGLAVVVPGVSGEVNIARWETVDLVPSVAKPPIARVVSAATAFVSGLDTSRVYEVRIEQQPNQNICMKVLSHVLQALFESLPAAPAVRIISPKAYKTPGMTYARRKKDSVARVCTMLQGPGLEVWRAHFASHAKKDDLADALLLATWSP
tara:strand:+ start:545 stop:1030 length:486 start_codon:yes stop_codon:yes gene_type:complete